MSESKTTSGNGADAESIRDAAVGVMADAQEWLKTGAGQVAERLPEALAGAQVAARDTQRALDSMPDQSLVVGTSFSLGLAVGLFFGGFNRLLVLMALAPAIAMLTTLLRRDADSGPGRPTAAESDTD